MHRALVSLREELEAVDWYRQRADACADESLRGILLHNMREDIEHACMLLEWLRRNDADFDENMAAYLFTKGADVLAEEEQAAGKAAQPDPDATSKETVGDPPAPAAASPVPFRLTIGSLKEAR
jgi:hypothetical protein